MTGQGVRLLGLAGRRIPPAAPRRGPRGLAAAAAPARTRSAFRSPQAEHGHLQSLFEKYVPYLVDVIVEGIVDGRQGEKLKTIVPQTDLNMVRRGPGPGRARGGSGHAFPPPWEPRSRSP